MFGLLVGKEVTLFEYDLPALDLQFLYEQTFPIFTGLNVNFGGEVTATTNLGFGLTTRGFLEFQAGGFDPADIPLIFTQGFYLSDHGIEGTSADEPEATLTAKIFGGPSIGVGGFVEVGLEAFIKATVNFDLNDDPNAGTGILNDYNDPNSGYLVAPEYDGKLYLDELLNDPECIFTIYGDLSVGLDVYFWVGVEVLGGKVTIFEARKNLFTAVLYDFRLECSDEVPNFARLDDATGELQLLLSPQTNGGTTTGDRFLVTTTTLPNPAGGEQEVVQVERTWPEHVLRSRPRDDNYVGRHRL